MFRTEIKYGIITGIGICLWILAEYFLGLHTNKMEIGEITIYFAIIIPLITICLGIKEKRDKANKGNISIYNGIKTGLMISLISTVILAIFLIIYFNYINPEYTEMGVAYHKTKMIRRGKSSVEIELETEKIRAMLGYVNQFLFGTLGIIGSGFIISVVAALVLKKDAETIS